MSRAHTFAIGAAFATASAFAMLAGGLRQAPADQPSNFNLAPVIASADQGDRGDRQGDAQNCINPAGHPRGWCKHAGDPNYSLNCKSNGDRDNDGDNQSRCKYKKNKHHNTRGNTTVNGTVTSVRGNMATVQLDGGGSIPVNENGTALNVGQHYTLNGCYRDNVFVLGCYSNGNYPGGQNQNISGTIVGVGNGTITLAGLPPVTINAQQAMNNNATNGSLFVGRHITARGYYQNGMFFATSVQ